VDEDVEDETFRGAIVTSLSLPWGDAKDDEEIGAFRRRRDAWEGRTSPFAVA
jgi:hypothetical protein